MHCGVDLAKRIGPTVMSMSGHDVTADVLRPAAVGYSDSSHRREACGLYALAEGIRVGIGIQVEGLTKSFGSQRIWEDVTMEVPAGEVSVLLGPSVSVKSVFVKSLICLLRPERG